MAFAYTIIRRFHGGALTATALASAFARGCRSSRHRRSRPLARTSSIVTDDQAAHTLRREVMSLLDRIGGIATSFTNAIVTTPLCCPSRASMLTGQYGHNNGVVRNDYRQLNAKGNILPRGCSASGTGRSTSEVPEPVARRRTEPRPARGWDLWQTLQEPNTYYDYKLSVDGRSHRYGTADRDYVTDVLTRRTARLIRRRPTTSRSTSSSTSGLHYDGRGTWIASGQDPVPAPSDGGLFVTSHCPSRRLSTRRT